MASSIGETDPEQADTDGDQLSDLYELLRHRPPRDTDSDGLQDGDELQLIHSSQILTATSFPMGSKTSTAMDVAK